MTETRQSSKYETTDQNPGNQMSPGMPIAGQASHQGCSDQVGGPSGDDCKLPRLCSSETSSVEERWRSLGLSAEYALRQALRGEVVPFRVQHHLIYTDYRDADRTVVMVIDPDEARRQHKYIIAKKDHHTYVVVAPVAMCEYHADILSAIPGYAVCRGGGYIEVQEAQTVRVFGRSMDFGPGDHDTAKIALEGAMRETIRRQSESGAN